MTTKRTFPDPAHLNPDQVLKAKQTGAIRRLRGADHRRPSPVVPDPARWPPS